MPWFDIAIYTGLILLIPTAYAGKIGAPYVPARMKVIRKALREIGLEKDDVFIELGAGDGSATFAAAKLGVKQAIGYELSPIMWAIAYIRSLFHKNARIVYANFYKKDISKATVIYTFLMPKTLPRLIQHLSKQDMPNGKFLLTYLFPVKDMQPLTVIREPKCGPVYVYDLQELMKNK